MSKTTSTSAISASLENFDELPNSAHVRLPVVQALYACSGPTVWRRVKAGLIPQPRKLGERTSCWNVGELREVLNKAA
jgi:predicted DNA-binding transcriptional regulator AlpA